MTLQEQLTQAHQQMLEQDRHKVASMKAMRNRDQHLWTYVNLPQAIWWHRMRKMSLREAV